MEREIDFKKFLILMVVLGFVEAFIMCYIYPRVKANRIAKEMQEHCKLAVCNETSTICYNYDINSNGKTIVTWRGSCKK